MQRPNNLSVAGWRALFGRPRRAPTRSKPGLAALIADELRHPGGALAAGLETASSMPTCFPTTCSSSATSSRASSISISPAPISSPTTSRSASTPGASRGTAFNVTKARQMLRGYELARDPGGRDRRPAAAGARRGAALPADPALRLAQPSARRLREAQGPAGISPQAALPPAVQAAAAYGI